MLPKSIKELSNGGLYQQAVRCGNPNCKCAHGHLHTGYYYFFTRIDGRLRKFYIRKAEVEGFRQLLKTAAERRAAYKRKVQESNKLLSEFRFKLREMATSGGEGAET